MKDKSRLVVLVLVVLSLCIVGGAIYFVYKPQISSVNVAPSVSPITSGSAMVAPTRAPEELTELTEYIYQSSQTSIMHHPEWKVNSFNAGGVGQASMIQEPSTGGGVYSITLSEKSLTTRNIVVESRDINLDNGQSAKLLFTRAPGTVGENVTDILLASKEIAVADVADSTSLDGVGTKPIFVTINLLAPGVRSNPGRPIGDFTGARYEQVIRTLKTFKKVN
ncbi:hypothetical protein IPM44_04130 [bacterium]|nr:MAG: hypothetical protein IPM44_04130 [bacterium]